VVIVIIIIIIIVSACQNAMALFRQLMTNCHFNVGPPARQFLHLPKPLLSQYSHVLAVRTKSVK
jgi:hypothetical protein